MPSKALRRPIKRWKISFIILMMNVYQKRYHISFGLLLSAYFAVIWRHSESKRIKPYKSQKDRTVIITGANSGIGKCVAYEFAKRGARVIMACRDVRKGKCVANNILAEIADATIEVEYLDLADLASVRAFCELILDREPNIHILINNAGIMMAPQGKTADGFELHFGTNHLGHFLLTMLLLDRIKASAPGRIINVSSLAHYGGEIYWHDINMDEEYQAFAAYCQSKLANVLFTRHLANLLKDTGIQVFAVHPGIVNTNLYKYLPKFFLFELVKKYWMTSSSEAAQYILKCALCDSLNHKTGLYFSKDTERTPSLEARSDEAAQRLWDLSSEMVQLTEGRQ